MGRRRYTYRDAEHFMELLANTPMLLTAHLRQAMVMAFNAARLVEEVPDPERDDDSRSTQAKRDG